MTGHDDFDRTLAGWLEADALSPAPADGLDRVLDATRRRRPRPAWFAGLGSRWVGEALNPGSSSGVRRMRPFGLRWSTALILLLAIAALVGAAILVGARLSQPSPLATGRFAYGVGGNIYVADWDGRNPVRIADGASGAIPDSCGGFWGEGDIWSPDGQHLAYRSGCGAVFISDPVGHVVASFPGTGWRVSWSLDSTRVATWVDLSQTIGIYGLDSVRQTLLTLPPGLTPHGDSDPVWSPDGESLLIALGPLPPTQVISQVWELPVDGRTPRPLPSSDPRSNARAVSSPDGSRLAYLAERKQPPPFLFPAESLVVSASDGSQDRVLVLGGIASSGLTSLVWSPTGDRIAFDEGPLPAQEIGMIDVASGRVTSLARARGTESLGVIRFSARGDRILFAKWDANNVTSLWSVRTDASDAELLVDGTNWGDWQSLPASSMPAAAR